MGEDWGCWEGDGMEGMEGEVRGTLGGNVGG